MLKFPKIIVGQSMKSVFVKLVSLVVAVIVTTSFSGCMDEYLHSMPKCTDDGVVEKLVTLVNANSMYGSKAVVNEKLIILVGVNEKTKMKTCKTKVDYSLKNEDNNSMVSMMNSMPFMSDMSKNRDVTYTLTQTEDKKGFVIEIIE